MNKFYIRSPFTHTISTFTKLHKMILTFWKGAEGNQVCSNLDVFREL